ncbi:MAG: DinB family protein [Bacteroidota bacterium]
MGLALANDSKSYCQELFRFHRWRQYKISELLTQVGAKYFSRQLNGSFSSLFIILNHLVWAEKVWLGRVNNNEVATMRDSSVAELLAAWREITDKWAHHVETTPQEAFEETVVYFNSKGHRFENDLSEIVVHLIDHSTYHIGQMMNAVRGFGIEPVSTNYIHYLRAKLKEEEL